METRSYTSLASNRISRLPALETIRPRYPSVLEPTYISAKRPATGDVSGMAFSCQGRSVQRVDRLAALQGLEYQARKGYHAADYASYLASSGTSNWIHPDKVIRLIFDRLNDANMPLEKNKFKPFRHAHVPAPKELHLDGLPHKYLTARIRETLQVFKASPKIKFIGAQERAKFVQEALSQFPGLRVFGFLHTTSRPFADRELQYNQVLQTRPLPPVLHNTLQEIIIQEDGAIADIIACSLLLPHARYFMDEFPRELALGIGCLQYLDLGPFPSLIRLRLIGSAILMWGQSNRGKDPRNFPNLAHLLSTLQLLPQLRSLTFENVNFEHNLYLSKCLGTAKCCPVLQWLSVLQCVAYEWQELRVIVEARRGLKNVDPLRQITLYEWPGRSSITPEEQEILDWLGEAVEFRVPTTIYEDRERHNYLRVVEGIGREHQL